MKVSIIIPTLGKRPEMLARCIESCQNQITTAEVEVLISESPGTAGVNFNRALKEAQGEFIKLISDDDTLPPNSIADLLRVAEETEADIVHGDALIVFGDGHTRTQRPSNPKPSLEQLLYHNSIHAQTVLYRADLFKRIGGWDESLWTGEEYEFHLRALKAGATIAYCPKIVATYTRHGGQKSLGNPDPKYQAKRMAVIDGFKQRYL